MAANPKQQRFRSKALLDTARGRPCVLCGDSTTTVPAHLPGAFYGMPAGTGQKTHDWLVAHLCHTCHAHIDSDGRKDAQLRMKALCLTLQRLFDEGLLSVTKGRC